MMTTQAGVRTVVVGGRPEQGPMQAASGSRGALAYTSYQLDADIADAIKHNPGAASSLPPLDNSTDQRDSGMYLIAAGLNLRDQVRSANYTSDSAAEDDGGAPLPLQFAYEAADCRLYWTLDNALNMTRLWADAASAMWAGLPGGSNASCVPGSTGYASHGVNATASNPAPESTATSVASLPAVEWDYDVSPGEASNAGLEDGLKPRSGVTAASIIPCDPADEGKLCPDRQTTCRFVQTTCKNGKAATGASRCVPPCSPSSGCGISGLFCDASGGRFFESNNFNKLKKPAVGGSTHAGLKQESRGYCVPTPSSNLNVKFGCPI